MSLMSVNSVWRRSSRSEKMAALQKLKLLALHCGATAAQMSPARSPVVHLRRRKPSLFMLLSRSGSRRSRRESAPAPERRNSLEELFVSSPPFEGCERIEKLPEFKMVVTSAVRRKGGGVGPGSPKPGWTGFRYKKSAEESLAAGVGYYSRVNE